MKRSTRTREGYHWFRGWRKPSAAQRRVLNELAEGRTNAEIAATLGISEDGVKWHLSELREELELSGRRELAEWWRQERQRSAAFLPLGGLGRLLGNHTTAALLAAAVVGTAIAWLTYSGLRGSDDGVAAGPIGARTPAAPAAVIVPTPTPTPVPPTALVFDTATAEVRQLPGTIYYRLWLDTQAQTFVGHAGSGPAIIDAEGRIEPLANAGAVTAYYPLTDRGQVVLWRFNERTLSLLDIATLTERPLIDLALAPGGWVADVSASSRKVAILDEAAGELRTSGLDGTAARLVYTAPAGEGITDAHWSPDGSRLLLHLGQRQANGQTGSRERFVVVDSTGRVLAEHQGTASWAGSGMLLRFSGSHGQAPSTSLNLLDGTAAAAIDPDSLLCVSPDGRYGLYRFPAVVVSRTYRYELRNLSAGSTVVEVESGNQLVNCDWTPDSRRAVLSPGGK
jgi:DNA-binding CsgD family transcriptional regulator